MKHIIIAFCSSIFAFSLGILDCSAQEINHNKMMDSITESTKGEIETQKIAILIYQNVVLQDFAGPIEVFSKARKLTKGKYEIFTVALDTSIIRTENNIIKLKADYTINNMPEANYLIIPGASMPVINTLIENNTFTNFITDWSNKEKTKTVSICTGSYLLANTNALNNKKATTHYFVADDFSKQYSQIELIKNVRFVDEKKFITSSGITSGIDTALYIVGNHSGEKIKQMISRALQYEFHEKEDWPIAPNGMKYRRKTKSTDR
ncbi:DJ-1/PfpI family protein [Aquimarina sp. MAR_2010_214]|uniref:DJ-1/PfpI family protein n=1 Tax=Aquimarina sp. MAR_2010_214 TaxID=1250026 RepID=UPI000C6FEDAB|nr:DJ-1/PfpI family protein [Aquimarina sp. MAR_2010_214]PKV50906.1 DJ-1/PfpI family protein [Aquimarina sp. MAR_2010_214]